MKFHLISRRSFFVNQPIGSFHDSLFHGSADRGGAKPNRKNARLHCDPDRPLQLHKNAFGLADVFAPEHLFVVSARVRDALAAIPRLKFEPIVFKTLFTFPFAAGDFSFWKLLPTSNDQEQLIDEQNDHPELHAGLGDYFLFAAPYWFELKSRYPNVLTVRVKKNLDDREIPMSEQLLRDQPAFYLGGLIVSEAVFARLSPFIDWKYFEHAEGRL